MKYEQFNAVKSSHHRLYIAIRP